MPEVAMPSYLDQKVAFRRAFRKDGGFHMAFKTGPKVLVAEYFPENYPAFTMGIIDSMEDYEESVKDIDWIAKAPYCG